MRKPDYGRRQVAVRAAMQEVGLSALVLFGMSSYAGLGSIAHGYIRYLTGWTSRFSASMLILPLDGSPTLLVPSATDVLYVGESFPWIERCVSASPRDYGKLARDELLGLGAQSVGVVGLAEMPQSIYHELVGGGLLPSFAVADHLIDSLRAVKDPVEIELHRRAAHISDEMLARLVECLSVHRGPAWKLVVEMEYTGRSLGAELATCWLVTGQPADRPRRVLEENEREVRTGDQVLAGTLVTYRGYWAHCVRMGSIGAAAAEFRRLYDIVMQQHRVAVAQVRGGGDARLIQAEADRFAEKALPGSRKHPALGRHAHFLGLDYADWPSRLAFDSPPGPSAGVLLRPGMVLEVHTNLGVVDSGFAMMGDVYLVRESEAERLTSFPQDLFVA